MDIFDLPLTPENTAKLRETNPYHPQTIQTNLPENWKVSSEYTVFCINIDFKIGAITLCNSKRKPRETNNTHFTPYYQAPLKTLGDLNAVWKIFVGKDLTPR